VSRSALLYPENHEKRGTRLSSLGAWTEEKQDEMTNKDKQVSNPNGFDGGTCGPAVSKESFAASKKLVRTKHDERALAMGATKRWEG
jgi:hypothetical protein